MKDKFVLVEWKDITLAPVDMDTEKSMPTLSFFTVGKVLFEDKKNIELIWSWGKESDEYKTPTKFMNRMTIPKGAIAKITNLSNEQNKRHKREKRRK